MIWQIDLNKWLVDNGYYDKDVYKKYNSKIRACNSETFQAAKKNGYFSIKIHLNHLTEKSFINSSLSNKAI